MIIAATPLGHLEAMTDARGMFEHAELDRPRPEHGYCLDDAARALIVAVREDGHSPVAHRLAARYFAFVDSAIGEAGSAHNRMAAGGRWIDGRGVGDWWGRAVWSLGIAATRSSIPAIRSGARRAFRRAARASGQDLRAMAFATLGAAELLGVDPHDSDARRLVERAAATITASRSAVWEWPEDRLRYANGAVPEALIAAGTALDDEALTDRGLRLLRFLIAIETHEGHLSVAPVAGRGPRDASPRFDQQPIEVAAIAEACMRAFQVTGDELWAHQVGVAWAWFEGENDIGVAMFDPETGAGYDGLTSRGRNENRGAESTLAALSTLQCLRHCRAAG